MKQHPLFAWDKVINVNSYHHQSIKNLAPEFEVIGVHEDSTIEMIVHRRLPIFAVQWHPEVNSNSPESKIIFDAFAKLVKANF